MKRYLLIGFFVALINCFGAVSVFGVDVTINSDTELSTLLTRIPDGGTLVVNMGKKNISVIVSSNTTISANQVVVIKGNIKVDGNGVELIVNGEMTSEETLIDNKADLTVNAGGNAILGEVEFKNNSHLTANGNIKLKQ